MVKKYKMWSVEDGGHDNIMKVFFEKNDFDVCETNWVNVDGTKIK